MSFILNALQKIFEDDYAVYARDSRLTGPYEKLRDTYENVDEFREGDFPERLLRLINRPRQELEGTGGIRAGKILTTPELTEVIYKTDFPWLRAYPLAMSPLRNRRLCSFELIWIALDHCGRHNQRYTYRPVSNGCGKAN